MNSQTIDAHLSVLIFVTVKSAAGDPGSEMHDHQIKRPLATTFAAIRHLLW
jgi:hypothetical protein